MLLIFVVLLAVLTVPVFGGQLTKLADVRFRAVWLVAAAVAIQVAIVTVFPEGTPWVHRAAHLASYILAGCFLAANRRVPGLWLVAVGGVLNLLAISANGGVMPVMPGAASAAGLSAAGTGFQNSAVVAAPTLSFLGSLTNAYRQFRADNNTAAGADHVNFSLKATGEAVGISAPNGTEIDGVSFGRLSRRA